MLEEIALVCFLLCVVHLVKWLIICTRNIFEIEPKIEYFNNGLIAEYDRCTCPDAFVKRNME